MIMETFGPDRTKSLPISQILEVSEFSGLGRRGCDAGHIGLSNAGRTAGAVVRVVGGLPD